MIFFVDDFNSHHADWISLFSCISIKLSFFGSFSDTFSSQPIDSPTHESDLYCLLGNNDYSQMM